MAAKAQTMKPRQFEMTDHLRALAAAAAERGKQGAPQLRVQNQTHAFFELYADLPLWERQARSLAYAMVHEPVRLFPGERVNGVFYGGGDPQLADGAWGEFSAFPTAAARIAKEIPELAELANQWPEREPEAGKGSYLINGGASPGHVAWNFDLILAHGVEGLMAMHREAFAHAADERAREYYQGVLILLEAMLEWNRRHVEELRRMLDAAETEDERAFIAENIAVMERVPARPARSFREAIQSFNFQWLAVMYEVPYGGNSPGRLDYFLWPYLKDELESGAISYQEAAELVAELFLKIDERVHLSDGHVNTIAVGGVAPDGSDAVTPLSYIMLDVFEQLNLTHPAVYTRLSNVNPPEYWDRCVDYMLHGGNRAQILIDEAIIGAMTRDGRMPFSDAAQYMCGGCMEINPHGMNSDLLFSFIYNVPKTLELLITGGECLRTGQRQRLKLERRLGDYASFEEFYAEFVAQMRRALTVQFRCLDIYSEEMARCRPAFLESSMISDCLERGRSQQDGGARYADYGGTPLGLQNAADSLMAIKIAVFDEGFCTAEELIEALRDDFVGREDLRARLLALPKFGQGDEAADAMMGRLLADVCGIFDEYRNRHGRYVKPIIFTFVWAPEMGASLGASPDGRQSGQPIGHGLTPQSMAMCQGLGTALQSCTSLPQELVSGGASTMWDTDSRWINHELLRAVLQVFADQGGHIFQGNMTDVAELKRALETPGSYHHLMVRVGGFSARFVNLSRELQMEIIERQRHDQ
jgi:formate C-acetyltransferase